MSDYTLKDVLDFINSEIEDAYTEACKDLSTARKFVSDVQKLAKDYDANFFIVTDGASGYSNGNGKSNPAVKNARNNQIKWEKKYGFDPDEDWSDSVKESVELVNEAYIKNDNNIFYNKEAFENGDINLCFITGHSGSGKSTKAHSMKSDDIEVYELDDVVWNKMKFTMDNFKEYGDLIYSFFNGIGKKYYLDKDETYDGDNYEKDVINDFINYSMKYANSHKDKKYIIEGVWIYLQIPPEKLKDYAVYVVGTSAVLSMIRGIKRDHSDDDSNKIKRFARDVKTFIKRSKHLKNNEFYIKKYRDFYKNKEETVYDILEAYSNDVISYEDANDYLDMLALFED